MYCVYYNDIIIIENGCTIANHVNIHVLLYIYIYWNPFLPLPPSLSLSLSLPPSLQVSSQSKKRLDTIGGSRITTQPRHP